MRMVSTRCACSELQIGALREVVARERREAGDTVSETLVAGRRNTSKRTVARSIGRVSIRFGEDGGTLDRRRARGVLNPCARESQARTEKFLGVKPTSDHDEFSSCEGQQGAANAQNFWGVYQGCTGLWTAGYWLTRRLPQLHEPRYLNFQSVAPVAQRYHVTSDTLGREFDPGKWDFSH